ncbi:MAG: ferredoxin [Dehalococcoidia bacterium]|nr:ferredoxin [Dehalococcoidia bacterium]
MRVTIDLNRCIKSGECYYNHPALFRVGKDGFSTVLLQEPADPELRDEALAAREVCPAQAILIQQA